MVKSFRGSIIALTVIVESWIGSLFEKLISIKFYQICRFKKLCLFQTTKLCHFQTGSVKLGSGIAWLLRIVKGIQCKETGMADW